MGVLRSALRGTVFLIIVAGVLATMSLFLPAARAAPEMTATVGAGLSAAGAPVDIHLTGDLGGSWPAARAVVEVRGPGIPSDGGADWPLAATIGQDLGDLVGSLDVHVALPPSAFPREGGYRVTAKVSSGDTRTDHLDRVAGTRERSSPRDRTCVRVAGHGGRTSRSRRGLHR